MHRASKVSWRSATRPFFPSSAPGAVALRRRGRDGARRVRVDPRPRAHPSSVILCPTKREACPRVVGRLFIATASSTSQLRIEAGVLISDVTYSKGAPGEVMLDGTVSDPVACPSLCSPVGSRNPLSEISEARSTSRRDLISSGAPLARSCQTSPLGARRIATMLRGPAPRTVERSVP
jgi:hypothetical protein